MHLKKMGTRAVRSAGTNGGRTGGLYEKVTENPAKQRGTGAKDVAGAVPCSLDKAPIRSRSRIIRQLQRSGKAASFLPHRGETNGAKRYMRSKGARGNAKGGILIYHTQGADRASPQAKGGKARRGSFIRIEEKRIAN